MNARLLITVSATAGLFGLYVAYALATNAVIGVRDAGSKRMINLRPLPPPVETTELAEAFLADDAPWARDATYRVRSHNSYIYFQEFEQQKWESDDPINSIRFSPFAMLIHSSHDRPYSAVCRSAHVKFAHEFGIKNPDTGRPIGGALIGDVRIQGPDGLVLTGKDFHYSEESMRIWSDQDVAFRIGGHRGHAGGIQLDVAIDPQKVSRDEFAVSEIRNITLRNDVQLIMVPPEGGPDAQETTINCDRTLDYDTKLRTATFEKNVVVSRPTGPDETDTLRCDKLIVVFEPETGPGDANEPEATSESGEEAAPFGGLDTRLKFSRMLARGSRVVFDSEKQNLHAEMDQLLYSAQERQAVLSALQYVHVQQAETTIVCPEIVILQDPHGKVHSLWCRNAGELQHVDPQTGQLDLAARWGRQLRVTPEEGTGLHLIELERHAAVFQPQEKVDLSAEYIRLWVRQNAEGSGAAASAAPGGESWRGSKVTPERMLAIENVRFHSENLQGSTRRLEAWFQEEQSPLDLTAQPQPLPGLHSASRPADAAPKLLPRDVQRAQYSVADERALPTIAPGRASSVRRPYRRTPDSERIAKPTPPPNRGRSSEPMQISAEQIKLNVVREAETGQAHVRQVITTGNVNLQQAGQGGDSSLKIEGDRIEVDNPDASNVNQIVHVYGKPARILNPEMNLSGNKLHLDRRSNTARVVGPGVMQTFVNSDLEGNKLAGPSALNVWWKQQMVFDGRTASFYEDVRTQLDESSLFCQEMQVVLSRRIDFQEEGTGGNASRRETDIDSLVCKYAVELESRKIVDGKLDEVRRGQFQEMRYRRETQKTHITGPGQFTLWRAARPNRNAPGASERAAANRSLRIREKQWESYHIEFSGDVDGNLSSQFTRFEDKVSVLYGPVAKPLDRFSVDGLPVGGGWMRCDTLDVAMHPETKTQQGWIELFADGNVNLEGRGENNQTYYARSETLSYDESKLTYRLTSDGNPSASISIETPGKPDSGGDAKTIVFRPEDMYLELDGTTRFEGSN